MARRVANFPRNLLVHVAYLGAGSVLALLCGLLGGFICLAVDFDHVLVLVARGIPLTLENLATIAGRPWHTPGLVVTGAVFIVVWALVARFHLEG